MNEKIKQFIDRVIRDDYSRLDEDLKHIVCTKIAERVNIEVKKIRSQEK